MKIHHRQSPAAMPPRSQLSRSPSPDGPSSTSSLRGCLLPHQFLPGCPIVSTRLSTALRSPETSLENLIPTDSTSSTLAELFYPTPSFRETGRIPTKTPFVLVQSSGKDSSLSNVPLQVFNTSCFLMARSPNLALLVSNRSCLRAALIEDTHRYPT